MVLGEISAGLSIVDRLFGWVRLWRKPESVATRFVRSLESHGVHRNQIPRFIGYGLTLADVQDDETLLTKLDEDVLDDVGKRFAVRREWLDGAEAEIYPRHYKYPEDFSKFIERLIKNNPDANLRGVVIAPQQPDDVEALFLLQETIGHIGEKEIYRYHFCDSWALAYWKSLAYLAACAAIVFAHGGYVHGVHLPNAEIEQMQEGKILLGWQSEGVWKLGRVSWHPEDLALYPEVFVSHIDPELDDFGIRSGLELWLDLEKQGLMNTGIKDSPRELFQQELEKYLSGKNG